MYSFTVTIINGGYMFRLQSSHFQSVCIRCIKRNCIRVVYRHKISFYTSDIYTHTHTQTDDGYFVAETCRHHL